MTRSVIEKAVAILQRGGLVAIPTETVYGLGADAANESAVRAIFRAKSRPETHPLIVHIANREKLTDWACDISPQAIRLADAFWPGPLTLILKKQPHVLDVVTAGQQTIGLRVPAHPVAQSLLTAFGGGVAAPSANQFTHVSPTTAKAVQEELGNQVDLILDGGHCVVGLESTILDMSTDTPRLLRPGMITAQEISAVLGVSVLSLQSNNATVRVPGSHFLHYAPLTPTRLMATQLIPAYLQSLSERDWPVAIMAYSVLQLKQDEKVHYVPMPASAEAYAQQLYYQLRELDKRHFKCIVIETVPDTPVWDAIRDRLMKASAR
jgi:L-threonylcarbamoyladenylate synthase